MAPADGCRFWAERGDGSSVEMGAEGAVAPSVLRLRLPRPAEVSVIRDGEPVHAERADRLDLEISQPGAYRVEARVDGRFWLLSNPVHLRAGRAS